MQPFPERPESQEIQALRIIYGGIQQLMSSFDDLVAISNTLVANEATLGTEVAALSTSIERLVTDFDEIKTSGVLTADQQAKLDATVQAVTGASADLAQQVSKLTGEGSAVDSADPAQPLPNPTPTAEHHSGGHKH